MEKELKRTAEANRVFAESSWTSDKKLLGVIKEELLEIRDKYGIDRRSDIRGEVEEIKVNLEVMVAPEDVMVTLTNEGYIKRTSMLSFTRSGGEVESTGVKEGDYRPRHRLEVNTLDNLLIFTQKGPVFPLARASDSGISNGRIRERRIVNVIPIAKEDSIVSVIPVQDMPMKIRTRLWCS